MRSSTTRPSAGSSAFYGCWVISVFLGLTFISAGEAGAAGWDLGPRSLANGALSAAAGDLTPETARDNVDDPVGDTFGLGPEQIDINGFSAQVENGDLIITATFAGAISPPDSAEPNAVDGFIDIDADQNGATGRQPNVDAVREDGGTTGMGNEFFVDLFSYSSSDGAADLVDDVTQDLVGRVPVGFTANSLAVQIPLSLLGDTGGVNTAAVLGTLDEPTDLVPNQGYVTSLSPPITLHNGRFDVSAEWEDFEGNRGLAKLVATSDTSAILYFFTLDNWEVLVKVIDGCALNGHYWVFAAAATNVEYTLTVSDTDTHMTRQYMNPLSQPAGTILDTQAFATCP